MLNQGFVTAATVFKAELLHRAQAVGEAAEADELDVGVVVARAAGVVIAAAGDAVVGQHAQERRGHLRGIHPFDELVAAQLDFEEMLELRAIRGEQVVESLERIRFARARAELFAGHRIHAVVQREFEALSAC